MQESITTLIYLLRPILGINAGYRVFGVDLLDMLTILLMFVLFMVWFLDSRSRSISKLDLAIIIYVSWCIVVSLIYFEKVLLSETGKFILPPITYVIFKSFIRDRLHFIRCLKWMLIGLLVPTLISIVFIAQGKGLNQLNYWTGLQRYQGVFVNPHNFGHTMNFMLMIAIIFIWFKFTTEKSRGARFTASELILLGLVIASGLFALYVSYVRTAWLGLVIFILIFAYKYSKKLTSVIVVGMVIGGLLLLPFLKLVFHDIAEVAEGERSAERIASGRPYIWGHNWEIFKKLTFDRKLAGVGIGNRGHVLSTQHGKDNVWNSHNDFLEVFMQTGIIGFIIFLL